MHLAARWNRYQIAKYLVGDNPDPDVCNRRNRSMKSARQVTPGYILGICVTQYECGVCNKVAEGLGYKELAELFPTHAKALRSRFKFAGKLAQGLKDEI